MSHPTHKMLAQLGAGRSIESVCAEAGLTRDQFNDWWQQEIAARVPPAIGTVRGAVQSSVRIARDALGIPHVFAANDDDLFYGFGYATAQDRLFQLDYLRRRAAGRLSEILGSEGLELDLVARTVGLPQIAEAEWEACPAETRQLIVAFTAGINALIEASRTALPIEFDLLEYSPEAWRPQDCLAIAAEFRWYLTGRFPVIAIPELAKRTLGDGALYEAFLLAEADEESILPPGAVKAAHSGVQPVGVSVGDPQEGHGSNNWVVSGARSASGKPLVASDPHIAFAAVSCWHEVRLTGGSFDVAGMAYAGMPAVMFGRNRKVAWGCTNNICSQRDLYEEQTDPAHPGKFLYDGRWEPERSREEVIAVKGQAPVRKTIRASRNGPIVNEILPAPVREMTTVSLKWLGSSPCGWLTALLAMDRAPTADAFRQATRPWHVPTFSVVYGDVEGRIGYQCTGRIPLRQTWERGYRKGWLPEHQWQGLIPFEGMPADVDPDRGWLATANNRITAEDFPYPLSGTWSSGHRALRIRQMLEARPRCSRSDFGQMHQDVQSPRAVECLPLLIEVLARQSDPQIGAALVHLKEWDCRVEPDRVGAALFDVFFTHWSRAVADERFEPEPAAFVAGAIGGLAGQLLSGDRFGWFKSNRETAIVGAFRKTLETLSQFGPEMSQWTWGRLHTLQQKHILTARGCLGQLLDCGGQPVKGDMLTVCNTGMDPNWGAITGAGYRLIADLSEETLWAVDAGSESGHPGSPHYNDQITGWLAGEYHALSLGDGESSVQQAVLTIEPG